MVGLLGCEWVQDSALLNGLIHSQINPFVAYSAGEWLFYCRNSSAVEASAAWLLCSLSPCDAQSRLRTPESPTARRPSLEVITYLGLSSLYKCERQVSSAYTSPSCRKGKWAKASGYYCHHHHRGEKSLGKLNLYIDATESKYHRESSNPEVLFSRI